MVFKKGNPGRPPRAEPSSALLATVRSVIENPLDAAVNDPAPERAAGDDKTSDSAVEIENGLSADATLSPEAAPTPQDERALLASEIVRIRALRKPFGATTQKLALPTRPGYHRHWFNDTAGRVDEAKASGWNNVKGRDGGPIRRAVGTGRDNGVLYAYAMELPEVFWQEDMAARHKMAQDKMDAIKELPFRSKPGQAKASDKGKFYDPHEESGAGPVQIVKT
jgi:hypothetical protein